MNLRPIPGNIVVHTPTKEEAEELFDILNKNGYTGADGNSLNSGKFAGANKCYYIFAQERGVAVEGTPAYSFAEFKMLYCVEEKPQPKFQGGDIMRVIDATHPLYNKQVKLDAWVAGRNYWLTINGSCGLNEFSEDDLNPTPKQNRQKIWKKKN